MNDRNQEAPAISEKVRGWLTEAVEADASDLHLIAGYPPVLRLHGDLIEQPGPVLQGEENARTALHTLFGGQSGSAAQSEERRFFLPFGDGWPSAAASGPTCFTAADT